MPKALIFGVHGQDGFYLDQLLTQNGIEVTGVSRTPGEWTQGDVADRKLVESLVKEKKPQYIFHLAANSKVDHALLFEHQATIVNGTLNILESVHSHSPSSKIFIAGSGLQFDNTGEPINERSSFIASDAYSLARIQSVYAARYYRSKGIKTFVGYLFHHDSPLRSSAHLNKKIAEAAHAAAKGIDHPLSIGDISVEKEFGFAGDIVKGIFHLVQQDEIYEACIGTGKAYPVQKWLELCFDTAGKNWKDFVGQNKNYVPGFKRLVSDPSAIEATGWKAGTSIEELAAMMINSLSQK